MDEVFNVGETILLDGKPLLLVTRAGVEAWIEDGVQCSYRYDQVRDPLDGQMNPLPLREGRSGCAVRPGQQSEQWRRARDPVRQAKGSRES